MSDKHVLCTYCRSTFTDKEILGATSCPTCNSESIPADTNKSHTITLSDQEWRILFIWASNYADTLGDNSPGPTIIKGITAEVVRQCPDIPPLSLLSEVQAMANALNTKCTITKYDTQTEVVPVTKH